MSTKVYNAYRMPKGYDIMRGIPHLREALEPIHREAVLRSVGKVSLILANTRSISETHRLVTGDVGDRHYRMSTLQSTAAIILERLQHRLRQADSHWVEPTFDLTFEITYLPGPDDRTYAMLFGNHKLYSEAWAKTTGAEDFEYWNNSDQPDEVTEDQWVERGQIWDKVLGDEPPVSVGVNWSYRPMSPSLLGYGDNFVQVGEIIAAMQSDYDSDNPWSARSLIDTVGIEVFNQPIAEILEEQA